MKDSTRIEVIAEILNEVFTKVNTNKETIQPAQASAAYASALLMISVLIMEKFTLEQREWISEVWPMLFNNTPAEWLKGISDTAKQLEKIGN